MNSHQCKKHAKEAAKTLALKSDSLLTRRTILRGLATSGVFISLPHLLRAQFPPQSVIDEDPLRPRYHLMPKRGWMNDPCGPVFFKGKYHIFFQYNPGASVGADMHWGHAVSSDMIHWLHRPVALAPTPGGADAGGVWTGTIVIDNGVPTILYTGVAQVSVEQATIWGSRPPLRETENLATSVDDTLDRWNKLPQPVISAPPQGMKVTGFRDPTPWREGDTWYLLIASGEKGNGGNVLLYKSPDLRHWEFQHIFAQGKPNNLKTDSTVYSGESWECPDFFPLEDKHILIHSTGTDEGLQTIWQSGTLNRATMQWTPEREGILNHGPYYAPKTQLDATGNRILWGWIPETRPQAEFAKAGWACCMSLPRVLSIKDGDLLFEPAVTVKTLREPDKTANDLRQAEFLFTVSRSTAPAGGPVTSLSGPLFVVVNDASPDGHIRWSNKTVISNKHLPDHFELRCFVDHSVVEIFVGDFLVLTERIYTSDSPVRLELPAGFSVQESHSYPLHSI
jgi:beta-fructofuranosidase